MDRQSRSSIDRSSTRSNCSRVRMRCRDCQRQSFQSLSVVSGKNRARNRAVRSFSWGRTGTRVVCAESNLSLESSAADAGFAGSLPRAARAGPAGFRRAPLLPGGSSRSGPAATFAAPSAASTWMSATSDYSGNLIRYL